MVNLNFTVDANATTERTVIAPGSYVAEIVDVSDRVSAAGNRYLSLQLKIEGHGNVWDTLNLWHPNSDVVSIAQQKLHRIGLAVGLTHIGDTDQLIARRVTIVVEQQKTHQGETRNAIKAYSAAPENNVPAPAAAAPSAPPWRAA